MRVLFAFWKRLCYNVRRIHMAYERGERLWMPSIPITPPFSCMWSDPKKLDNILKQKLFKQPKGLAVCELQAASPLALPWSCGCCSNPDIQRVPAWSVPWTETLVSTTVHFWVSQRNSLSQRCPDSCLSGSCSAEHLSSGAFAGTACAGIASPGQNEGSTRFHPVSSQKPYPA